MKCERIVAPSVLSLDFADTQSGLAMAAASKAKWIHYDVMDGHFVPNISFGPDVLKGMMKTCPLYMDVHLMVTDPEKWLPAFQKAGAANITFHTEALDNDPSRIKALIDKIHGMGMQAGISVKPATPIQPFEGLLGDLDLVLIMSVEPGFGGQSFMEDQLEKVRWLKQMRQDHDYAYRIEIDGGINGSTWQKAVEAGCDTLVAGSYLFGGDMERKVAEMLR